MPTLDRDPHVPFAWQGSMPIASRYTYGLAGERFFRAIKDEGRILGTRCVRCNLVYIPATIFCERCLSELEEWVDVGTTGEVYTYTLLYENYDGSPRQNPEIVAFVKLGDGGLIHCLEAEDPKDVFIGMQVEAVFKSPEEREGSILDITCFRRVKK